MKHPISELEFKAAIAVSLKDIDPTDFDFVVGPGRSGAIASVYASHMTGIKFLPWHNRVPDDKRRVLLIDTASQTGKTLRKARSRYISLNYEVDAIAVYDCPDTHYVFWFESKQD